MDLEVVTQIARWAFLALGGFVIVWALFTRGSAKGKRRCPKCWYDMSATEEMRCPECGREQKREKRFGKRRRSKKLVFVGVLLFLFAYAAHVTPDVKQGGWMWAVPRSVLVCFTLLAPAESIAVTEQFMVDIGHMNGTGCTVGAEPRPSLREKLRLHLLIERCSRSQFSSWEYTLLRDDLGRRAERGQLHDYVLGRFVSSQWSRVVRDERMLATLIMKDFGKPVVDRELSIPFRNKNILMIPCYDIALNDVCVRRWDRLGYSPSTAGALTTYTLHVHPSTIDYQFIVQLEGPERGLVRVEMTLPEDPFLRPLGEMPERIGFEFRLDEDFFENLPPPIPRLKARFPPPPLW